MFLYRLVVACVLPLLLLRLLIKAKKQPDYLHGLAERFGYTAAQKCDVWIHAVSVGEAHVAITLLRQLQARAPRKRYLITTTTPTGKATLAPVLDGTNCAHSYLPFDVAGCMTRFFRRVEPALLLVVETEVWPNMLAVAQRCACPAVLVNGRLSARSAAGYQARWLRALTKNVFNCFDMILAQSSADATRYQQLGFKGRIVVCGNIKFDAQAPVASDNSHIKKQPKTQQNADRFTWLALSLRDGEVIALAEAAMHMQQAVPGSQCILLPRHLHLVPHLVSAIAKTGLRCVVIRAPSEVVQCDEYDVIIVDVMGVVPDILVQVDCVFVGGSLVPLGGQNVLEPIAYGKPTCIGLHYFNFQAVVDGLRAEKGIVVVQDAEELVAQLRDWHINQDAAVALSCHAAHFYLANQGATARICDELTRYSMFSGAAFEKLTNGDTSIGKDVNKP